MNDLKTVKEKKTHQHYGLHKYRKFHLNVSEQCFTFIIPLHALAVWEACGIKVLTIL